MNKFFSFYSENYLIIKEKIFLGFLFLRIYKK